MRARLAIVTTVTAAVSVFGLAGTASAALAGPFKTSEECAAARLGYILGSGDKTVGPCKKATVNGKTGFYFSY
jgi:hypothetical protein